MTQLHPQLGQVSVLIADELAGLGQLTPDTFETAVLLQREHVVVKPDAQFAELRACADKAYANGRRRAVNRQRKRAQAQAPWRPDERRAQYHLDGGHAGHWSRMGYSYSLAKLREDEAEVDVRWEWRDQEPAVLDAMVRAARRAANRSAQASGNSFDVIPTLDFSPTAARSAAGVMQRWLTAAVPEDDEAMRSLVGAAADHGTSVARRWAYQHTAGYSGRVAARRERRRSAQELAVVDRAARAGRDGSGPLTDAEVRDAARTGGVVWR